MKTVGWNSSHHAFSEFKERKIILFLCLLAAIHVLLLSAAFPFFNIVDEQSHFDLVVRYSRGDIPRAPVPTSEEALPYIAIYGTPEYFWPRSAFPNGQIPPPLWNQPEKMMPHVLKTEAFWSRQTNHEATQPPVYYAIAGLWWRLGNLCGLHDGFLLYTVRFLNVFFIVGLVWLGFISGRLIFPENAFARIGVPTLLAFLPQTTFYSINNDVISPLSFGAAFIFITRLKQEEVPGIRLGTAAGLAIAATYLVKISNLPAVVVAFVAVGLIVRRMGQTGNLRAALPGLVAFVLCAILPIGGWLAWTKYHFGDCTGTTSKMQSLGWTLRPFGEWWEHPIFSLHGLWTFVSGLMATFWQGEFLWYGQPMTFHAVNTIYVILSIAFVGLALVNLLPRFTLATVAQRQALWFGFWSLAASVVFLAFLSVIYDFHDCFYPSRSHPYFTSGRLMGAALIPFLLLFVYGIDCLLSRSKSRLTRPLALVGFVLFMLTAEIAVDWPVFSNTYNWFHM